jgi:hypothetical protein
MLSRAQALEDLDVRSFSTGNGPQTRLQQTQQVRIFPPYMRLDDQQPLIVGWPSAAPGLGVGIGSFA